MVEKEISVEKLEKYFDYTERGIDKAEESIVSECSEEAEVLLDIASNYLEDAYYFKGKGDLVNAFAALNYAYGVLDGGAEVGFFEVEGKLLDD